MRDEEREEPTREPDDAEDSGMPEQEDDLAPLGVDDDDDAEDAERKAQPGIPTEDEPEIPG